MPAFGLLSPPPIAPACPFPPPPNTSISRSCDAPQKLPSLLPQIKHPLSPAPLDFYDSSHIKQSLFGFENVSPPEDLFNNSSSKALQDRDRGALEGVHGFSDVCGFPLYCSIGRSENLATGQCLSRHPFNSSPNSLHRQPSAQDSLQVSNIISRDATGGSTTPSVNSPIYNSSPPNQAWGTEGSHGEGKSCVSSSAFNMNGALLDSSPALVDNLSIHGLPAKGMDNYANTSTSCHGIGFDERSTRKNVSSQAKKDASVHSRINEKYLVSMTGNNGSHKMVSASDRLESPMDVLISDAPPKCELLISSIYNLSKVLLETMSAESLSNGEERALDGVERSICVLSNCLVKRSLGTNATTKPHVNPQRQSVSSKAPKSCTSRQNLASEAPQASEFCSCASYGARDNVIGSSGVNGAIPKAVGNVKVESDVEDAIHVSLMEYPQEPLVDVVGLRDELSRLVADAHEHRGNQKAMGSKVSQIKAMSKSLHPSVPSSSFAGLQEGEIAKREFNPQNVQTKAPKSSIRQNIANEAPEDSEFASSGPRKEVVGTSLGKDAIPEAVGKVKVVSDVEEAIHVCLRKYLEKLVDVLGMKDELSLLVRDTADEHIANQNALKAMGSEILQMRLEINWLRTLLMESVHQGGSVSRNGATMEGEVDSSEGSAVASADENNLQELWISILDGNILQQLLVEDNAKLHEGGVVYTRSLHRGEVDLEKHSQENWQDGDKKKIAEGRKMDMQSCSHQQGAGSYSAAPGRENTLGDWEVISVGCDMNL